MFESGYPDLSGGQADWADVPDPVPPSDDLVDVNDLWPPEDPTEVDVLIAAHHREPPETPILAPNADNHSVSDTDVDAETELADIDPDQVDWTALADQQGWAAVDEVEQAHALARIDDAGPDQTLALVAAAAKAERLAGARQLVLAAHWADLHGQVDSSAAALVPGSERLVELGGAGTPGVAEFAPAELGAMLAMTANAAGALIGDALDLRHRLPRLWARVQSGAVKPWLGRQVAQGSRKLTAAAAAHLDARIARMGDRVPWGRLRKIIDSIILTADPAEALSDTEQAEAERGVWVSDQVDHGVGSMFVRASAGDLQALEASIALLARALKELGDTDPREVRRSKAIGIIANPEMALALVDEAAAHRQARLAAHKAVKVKATEVAGDDGAQTSRDDDAETPGLPTVEGGAADRSPLVWGKATLYLHLTKADLDAMAQTGIVRAEAIGPLLLDQVRRWLQHRQVLLKPVIDPDQMRPVDCYEAPPQMSEALILTKPSDCFPYSPNLSRTQDREHTDTYVSMAHGGPPGQTSLDNLGRNGRGNHRAKTHGRWQVTQPRRGLFLWRSPHRYWYLVDEHGTTSLGQH